ncbi:hypothetical protein [Consotaella salsifontis]|uniref:Uncharacterized protein n=1 Tax=Consotaella salsifontis TaxID=1365950 RepID=A0A1T4MBH2_9HYPH|nr:hypothetical protein [Consotaella salsifontis]SJZ64054.1 hypothetical protein SAMN05428963_10247 [Consotaella salsifontis]
MPQSSAKMPKLVRFVLKNALIGVVFGWVVAALLLYFDMGGMGTRIAHSRDPIPPLVMLAMGFGVTFGFGYLATAVWFLPWDQESFDKLFKE